MVIIAVLAAPLAVLAGGAAARLGSRHVERGAALASGMLIALVAVDMIPDALGDEAASGLPAAVPAALALAVGIAAVATLSSLSRRSGTASAGCGCHGAGRAAAGGLTVHGLLEGVLLGFGLGVAHLAWLLVTAFAVHKAAEGFALAQSLRAEPGSPAPVRWLLLAGAGPAAGAVISAAVTLPDSVASLAAATIAGILTAVAVSIARDLLHRRPVEAAVAVVGGTAGMAALLWALGR